MRTLILMLALSLAEFHVSAQQWPESNAEWTYCIGDNTGTAPWLAGKVTLSYTRDTLIFGTTYNVVEPELYSTDTMNTYITRFEDDTIYRWINEQEYLYFTWNLSVGDVFTTYRSIAGTSDTACSSVLALEVIAEEPIEISGITLSKWTLRDTIGFKPDGFEDTWYFEYELIEQIGFPDLYRFHKWDEQPNCNLGIDEAYHYLGGYNDDVFPEWDDACPMASIDGSQKDALSFYPNPANSILYVDGFDPNAQFQLKNGLGKTVQSGTLSNTVDIGELPNGLYIFTITSSGIPHSYKLLIE